jgi:hypothetical protein
MKYFIYRLSVACVPTKLLLGVYEMILLFSGEKNVYVYKEYTAVDISHEKLGDEFAKSGLYMHFVIAHDISSNFQNSVLEVQGS